MQSDDFVSKCADCIWCNTPPENAGLPTFGWCERCKDWVDTYEVTNDNYNCFEGYNEEMEKNG